MNKIWNILVIAYLLSQISLVEATETPTTIYQCASPSVISVILVNEKGEYGIIGSGFVIDPDGWIVSNYHVFEKFITHNQATQQIKFLQPMAIKKDNEIYDIGQIVYRDPRRDIIIFKIVGKFNLPCVLLGDSDKIQIGDEVLAIGNPTGLERTLSTGVISQIRSAAGYTLLQTTVPISSGSSGGPLFNMNNRVIGITTASKVSDDPNTVTQNLNFAVPINYVQAILKEIRVAVNDDIQCSECGTILKKQAEHVQEILKEKEKQYQDCTLKCLQSSIDCWKTDDYCRDVSKRYDSSCVFHRKTNCFKNNEECKKNCEAMKLGFTPYSIIH